MADSENVKKKLWMITKM